MIVIIKQFVNDLIDVFYRCDTGTIINANIYKYIHTFHLFVIV